MFKLKKILNSSKSAPETVELPINDNTDIICGGMYFICDEGTLNSPHDTMNFITAVSLETVPAGSGRSTFKGYIVTEEMIFETIASGTLYEFGVGKLAYLGTNSKGVTDRAHGDAGGTQLMVLDISELNTDGVVTVKVMVSKL